MLNYADVAGMLPATLEFTSWNPAARFLEAQGPHAWYSATALIDTDSV